MQRALPASSSTAATQHPHLYSFTRLPPTQSQSRAAKRLPIGPTPKPIATDVPEQSRSKREGVVFSHTPRSSISSWQSINYTSSDLYPNFTPSPSPHAFYPTKPINHPSNEPTFHFCSETSPGPIHVSLPSLHPSAKGRAARPNLTIQVPSNDPSRPEVMITPSEKTPKLLLALSPTSPTPVSPLTFAYPTVHVVVPTHHQKRKRLDKLRRHLGENIPVELVFSNPQFAPSTETPRRKPIPRFASHKKTNPEASQSGWNILRVGTSTVSPGPFTRMFSGSISPSSQEDSWELVDSDDESTGSSDYHTAPEVPGARVKSWQGMWNIDNIDQVRAALRTLRAR